MWTLNKIKDGFIRYYNENGHYPSALEIDHCSYLLTSRSIQRNWGGLEALRQSFGLEITNYTKGKTRSNKTIYTNGCKIKKIHYPATKKLFLMITF